MIVSLCTMQVNKNAQKAISLHVEFKESNFSSM